MHFVTGLRLRNAFRGLQIIFLLIVPLPFSKSCKIENQDQLFDFSGLGLKPWNVSNITENHFGLVHASVSLCNHLHGSPCGNTSFCVVDKNHSKWFNFNSTPIVQESENFKISFFLKKMSSSSVINAEIKLKCSNEIGEPKLQEFKDNHLIILWETVAACKINYTDPYRRCIIRNDDIGEINFQSLRHLQYYSTEDNNQNTYYINVCGGTVSDSICPSVEGNVAACAIDSYNTSVILGLASRQHVVEKNFILQFRNKSRKILVEIKLICNLRVDNGELKFKSVEGERRIFELETSLVCLKKLPHCRVTDKDHYKYDLSSLSGKDYEVYDSQRNKYILSVCKTINNNLCPDGASVCFENGTSFVNLGTLGSGPEIIEEGNGVLQISSSGGSYCNSKFRYKTVIIFKCSKNYSHPTFLGITANCVYTFEWHTKAACPFMTEVGENCQVRDPALGYNFNLNSLRKNDEDYILSSNDGEKFHLNLCRGLVEPCNGSRDVGVCLTDLRGAQHKIGEVANLPHYDDGRLSFELSGGTCTSSESTSKVIIIFTCSHAAEEKVSYPSLFEKLENCTYIFLWPTTVACPKFTVHPCQVSDENGDKYDLSPLSLFDKDYIVWNNKTNIQRKYTINICQPVMFGNESRCLSQTGVCVQNVTEPILHKSFTSFGLASGLQYDKLRRILKVEYVNGGLCSSREKSERLSEIIFVCDREAIVPVVQLVNESDCVNEFLMKTKHACPISSDLKLINKGNSCKVHNTFTDIRADFSQFAGQEYSLNDTVGGRYKFTICGSLNNVSLPGIGMCREMATDCENLGIGNSNLRYEAGKLFLNYTDGVHCSSTEKSYTLIEFKCNRENEGIHLVTSNPCKFSVIWYTSMACVVPCKTDGAIEVSLSFFSSYERNYNTSVNGVDYFINICKPLVNQDGLNCYPGSAVCRAVPGKRNEWTNEVNLGFSHHRPILMDDKIVLNYSSNFHCPNNAVHNLTSSIVFECDHMVGIGSPVLMQLINECHYEFLWKTSVVCPNYKIQVGALYTGVIINNQSNTVLDLQPLCMTKTYKVGNYVISVCDSLFEVKKVEKERKISYGKANYILFNYSENMTQLFISQGDECVMNSKENYYAVISLLCSSKTDAHPHIWKETNCSVHFEWKTSAACAQHIPIDATTNTIAKSSIGILGVIVSTLVTVVASLCLYFFIRYSKALCCRRYINRFLSRRHQGNIHYSIVSMYLDKEA